MLGKGKTGKSSKTIKQFELFLKKRNENTNILRSEHEPINAKVKCFEELIRLTRTGNSITLQSSPSEDPHRSHSSKNTPLHPRQPHLVFEQDSEFVATKFNKMASELNSWNISKQVSKHQQNLKPASDKATHKCQLLTRSQDQKKIRQFQSTNSTNISRMLRKEGKAMKESKCQWLTQPEAQSKPEHYPIRKKNRAYMSRCFGSKKNHQYNASSPSLNIEIKQQNFTNLKQKITELQNKAKHQYGISFECQKETPQDFQQFSPPETHEYMRVVATADVNRRASDNDYSRLLNEHMREDSSIPASFLGIIRLAEVKRRPYTQASCPRRYIRV